MSLIERTIEISFRQRVYFTRHVFAPENALLSTIMEDSSGIAANGSRQVPKVLIVLDESLHAAQPKLARNIEGYFADRVGKLNLVCPPIVLEGGERVKNS